MKEVATFEQNITHWVKKLKEALEHSDKDTLLSIGKLNATRIIL
jgi:hypothetical protein